jgi:hypothetical protein
MDLSFSAFPPSRLETVQLPTRVLLWYDLLRAPTIPGDSMRNTMVLFSLALVALAAPTALAADAINLDLKTFKWKASFNGGEELGGYNEAESRFFLYTFGTAKGVVEIPEDGSIRLRSTPLATKRKRNSRRSN